MPTVEKAPPRARGAKESLERSIGRSSSRNASEAECSLDGVSGSTKKHNKANQKGETVKLKRLQKSTTSDFCCFLRKVLFHVEHWNCEHWSILSRSFVAPPSATAKPQVFTPKKLASSDRWSVQGPRVNDEWTTDLSHHFFAPCIPGVYSNYRFKGMECKYGMYIYM